MNIKGKQMVFVLGMMEALVSGSAAWGNSKATCPDARNDRWGIEIMGVRRTSAGYMLDFRYKVVEPEKAKLLLNRKEKPYLIIEESGDKLQVPVSPKIGPLRQSSSKVYADRNYFMLFGNPGRQVKAGDKVTVVVGEFRAEHIVVE